MNGRTGVSWPSALVASIRILAVATIVVVAIFRYEPDDVLRIWSALDILVGVIGGAVATYFFSSRATEAEKRTTEAVKAQVAAERRTTAAVEKRVEDLRSSKKKKKP